MKDPDIDRKNVQAHTHAQYLADLESRDNALEHVCLLAHTSRGLLRSELHTRICVLACVPFHTGAYLCTGRSHLCVTSGVCRNADKRIFFQVLSLAPCHVAPLCRGERLPRGKGLGHQSDREFTCYCDSCCRFRQTLEYQTK